MVEGGDGQTHAVGGDAVAELHTLENDITFDCQDSLSALGINVHRDDCAHLFYESSKHVILVRSCV